MINNRKGEKSCLDDPHSLLIWENKNAPSQGELATLNPGTLVSELTVVI